MRDYLLLISIPILLLFSHVANAEEYEVLPHKAEARGRFWASEGPAFVISENSSAANRFRLGIDLRLGPYSRFDIGWTIIDVISSSGERAESVGDISRFGSGPNFGYFVIPDRFWVMYTFNIESVKGSRVSGSVTSYGHQLGLGYRFYSNQDVNLSAELDYLYVPTVSVPVLDVNDNGAGTASYPAAQIWSISLVLGFDIG